MSRNYCSLRCVVIVVAYSNPLACACMRTPPVENSDDLACVLKRKREREREGKEEEEKKIQQREAFSSVAEAGSTGVETSIACCKLFE